VDKYLFSNQTTPGQVPINSVTYDPATFTATITFDNADTRWLSGNLYEITIKTVQNACGTSQTSVVRTFTTE